MFINSDSQLLSDLADTLQKDPGTLQSYWTRILSQCHALSYQWLVATMTSKGFTLSQVLSWDMGPFYERDLTLWMALRRGAALQTVDDKLLGTLDVRKEIQELNVLTIAGVAQDPAGTYAQPTTGSFDISNDIFVWPPQDGSRPDPGPDLGDSHGTRW